MEGEVGGTVPAIPNAAVTTSDFCITMGSSESPFFFFFFFFFFFLVFCFFVCLIVSLFHNCEGQFTCATQTKKITNFESKEDILSIYLIFPLGKGWPAPTKQVLQSL